MNDAIADSVLAVLLSVDSSPASVKLSSRSCGCSESQEDEPIKHASTSTEQRIDRISAMLKAQFGESYVLFEDKTGARITIDQMEATISFSDLSVECSAAPLKQRVVHILERAVNTVAPLAQTADRIKELDGITA
jgi:cleavage and polyadenylation specificity factor subunit 3